MDLFELDRHIDHQLKMQKMRKDSIKPRKASILETSGPITSSQSQANYYKGLF